MALGGWTIRSAPAGVLGGQTTVLPYAITPETYSLKKGDHKGFGCAELAKDLLEHAKELDSLWGLWATCARVGCTAADYRQLLDKINEANENTADALKAYKDAGCDRKIIS